MQLTPVWTNPYGNSFLPTLLHFNNLTVASEGVGGFALGNLTSPLSRPPASSRVVRMRVVPSGVHDTDSLTFGHKSQTFSFVSTSGTR